MPKKILLVDDDEDFMTLLEYRIKPIGCEIFKAISAAAALKILKEKKIDLIIMDRRLPGISGDVIAKQLKENESTKSIPIILISGLRAGDEEKIADYFFLKPFDWGEFLNTLKKII